MISFHLLFYLFIFAQMYNSGQLYRTNTQWQGARGRTMMLRQCFVVFNIVNLAIKCLKYTYLQLTWTFYKHGAVVRHQHDIFHIVTISILDMLGT